MLGDELQSPVTYHLSPGHHCRSQVFFFFLQDSKFMSNIVQLPFFKFPLGSFMSDLLAFLLPFLPVIWTRCPLQGEGGVKERAGADTWVKIKHSSCQMSLL